MWGIPTLIGKVLDVYCIVGKKADGTKAEVNTLTREMKWGSMWTITVNPKVEDTTGKVGITITFDDSTNDKPIDIEIPSDWL